MYINYYPIIFPPEAAINEAKALSVSILTPDSLFGSYLLESSTFIWPTLSLTGSKTSCNPFSLGNRSGLRFKYIATPIPINIATMITQAKPELSETS